MIKGHAKIELTDTTTGEKRVIHENNIVTDAFRRLFQATGNGYSFARWCTDNAVDFITNAAGGVLLFDKAIEENAATVLPPADVNMVGCAANIAYTGVQKERGSFNENESGFSEDGKSVKFVWDFATDQANGTIGCISLSSVSGGGIGYGCNELDKSSPFSFSKYKATKNVFDYESLGSDIVYIKDNTMYTLDFYTFKRDAGLADKYIRKSRTIRLRKYRVPITKVGIIDKYKPDTLELIEIPLPEDITLADNTREIYLASSYDADYIYLLINDTKEINSGVNFKIVRINVSSMTAESVDMTNTTGDVIQVRAFGEEDKYQYFTSGYMYTVTRDRNVYRIKIDNSTDVKKVVRNDGTDKIAEITSTFGSVAFITDFSGMLFFAEFEKSDFSYAIDMNTCVARYINAQGYSLGGGASNIQSGSTNKVIDDDMILVTGTKVDLSMMVNPMYLLTINNVNPAVTKTATQTMKITYTLTES